MEIEKKPFESPVVDIMDGAARWEIRVHDHGMVALVDVMPRLVPSGKGADFAIVQAARTSYGQGTKTVQEDHGLIRYLARHRHTTPSEMVEFKFHHIMPIFLARQWIRHRTANVNEISGRYSIIKDRFYHPSIEEIRQQSKTNRQGGEKTVSVDTANDFLKYLDSVEANYAGYERMVENGIAREQARIGLPLNIYTEWYWKIDLHNLFHFLSLRMESHAQKEMRDYANAMFELVKPIVPVAAQAFLDYNLNSMRLSSLEIEAIRTCQPLKSDNKRELAEWEDKKKQLGLP